MKILFLTPYPKGQAPSQRFRFEQYFKALESNGWTLHHQSFLSQPDWLILYSKGHVFQKLLILVKGYGKRLLSLLRMHHVKYVFIHRETAPFGPPILEWIIAKILRKRIIYDFDDAIWLTDKKNESKIEKYLRYRSKVGSTCKWSYKISCGNRYLAEYAKKFNQQIIINPTTIDTTVLHNPELYSETPTTEGVIIGWTGSHSTLKYIDSIVPVIQKLQAVYSFVDFLIIANEKPDLNISRMKFIRWTRETEAEDLLKIDIGIMPLPDDEWSKGKCGFKALQYMAMKKPCVASPVGVNSEIVEHGVNGFLAENSEEWYNHLEKLVRDKALRQQMGQSGRQKIIKNYSVASNTSTFLSLFE